MGNKRPRPARLAEKLLAIRKHLGLSQIKMTSLLQSDIAYHRISEFESGRRDPSLMILLQYARVGGVSVESLIDDNLDLHF